MDMLRQRVLQFLRWTEKYTKTDMVYLASGSSWSAFSIVVSGLISLGTAVAFANLLPKQTYGTYQYVLSIMALLGIISLPGIKTAISYASARGNDGSFMEAIRAKIRWGFVSSFVSIVIALYYYLHGNTLLGESLFIVAVFMPWWDVYGNYVPYLQGKKRFDLLAIYELGAQLFNAIAVVLLLLLTNSIVLLLVAYLASWTVARYFLFKRALHAAPPNDVREPAILSYAKHLSIMSIVATLASSADKLLLWHFLGPVEVAVYTFALTVPLRAVSAFASINRLFFPKAAVQDLHAMRGPLLRKGAALTLLTVATASVYIVLAPTLFSLVFPQYLESVPATQLVAVLIALQPLSLLATALSAHARKKALYVYNVLPPILQIVLLFMLVPHYHVLGAVVALLVAQIFEGVLLLGIFLYVSRKPVSD